MTAVIGVSYIPSSNEERETYFYLPPQLLTLICSVPAADFLLRKNSSYGKHSLARDAPYVFVAARPVIIYQPPSPCALTSPYTTAYSPYTYLLFLQPYHSAATAWKKIPSCNLRRGERIGCSARSAGVATLAFSFCAVVVCACNPLRTVGVTVSW